MQQDGAWMENMASFPDLRPYRRSAKAERSAASKNRARLLLAVSAALLLTAALAVPEFATLRGAKAHDASAFLTRELGPPLDSAPLVRNPASGTTVRLKRGGMHVKAAEGAVSLRLAAGTGTGSLRRHTHGVVRRTAFGTETVIVGTGQVEQFLTVKSSQGSRVWRWKLDSRLEPRLNAAGVVGFFTKTGRLTNLEISPVQILDAHGRKITPRNLSWSLARRAGGAWLELALDDASLPLPYTIDPSIVFRAQTTGTGTGSITTPSPYRIPAATSPGDIILVHVAAQRDTSNSINTPTGFAPVYGTQNISTATGTVQQVFWKKAVLADANAALTVNWTVAGDTGAANILVYKGVNTALANPFFPASLPAHYANVGAATDAFQLPSLNTTGNSNTMMVGFGAIDATNSPWDGLPAGWTTLRATTGTTNISIGDYDKLCATTCTTTAGATTTTSNNSSTGNSVGDDLAMITDATNPANVLSLNTVSPAAAAYLSGNTVWYRGVAAGSFKIRNSVTDAGSGPASSTTANLGGTATGWTHTGSAVTTPAGGPFDSNVFSWTAGTSSSPTEVVTAADNASNTLAAPTLTFQNDSTAPSTTDDTGSIGNAWRNTTTTVTLSPTDPGGSGVATTYYTTDGSTPTTSSSQGTSVVLSAEGTYTVKYFSVDNVGNSETVKTAGTQIRIDKTNPANALTLSSVSPAGSALKAGNTVYYRGVQAGGGSFKITNTVTDSGGSGPASSATAALGGTATGWTHTPSTVSTPAGGPYDSNTFTWAQSTSSSPTEVVTAADTAGNTTAAAALTFTNDSTAPAGGGALTVNGTVASGGGSSSYSSSGSFTIGTRTDYTETQTASE
ncbi:MAG: chitobiase/beta-hexosaminidase C-terminal domain-containing protein, partial [Actinomycetota bacterium]|nr:chitobiase/beta-hexosaminidase C-terminal domain-containing protein [Actinomycetota bacterium]